MAITFPADHRSLQPVLDSDPGAAENRGRTQKERTILKTPETDNLARGNHVVPTEWAEQLERERDEAREIAKQLIHIASHCLGWHDNTNPETIAEAIKRWNAASKK